MTNRLLPALMLLPALATTPALAQSTSIELTDNLPGSWTVTYLDLARIIAPGLKRVDGRYEGELAIPVRNVHYPDEPAVSGVPLSFYSAHSVRFTSNGVDLVALMLDAEGIDSYSTIMAIFDPEKPDPVLAIADVSSDQFTSFDEPALLPLGYEDDGILVSSSHFNSSQGYRNTSVIALVDGQLTEMASVFTFNENYCGMRREQTRALSPVVTDGDERWGPFTITVTETTHVSEAECENMDVASGTRAVAATFRWAAQSGRYEPDSTALDDLYAETEARF